jgi:hypothetical protein
MSVKGAVDDCTSGQDNTGQYRTGQDRTGQDRTGQDRTGQDRTGQDKGNKVTRHHQLESKAQERIIKKQC